MTVSEVSVTNSDSQSCSVLGVRATRTLTSIKGPNIKSLWGSRHWRISHEKVVASLLINMQNIVPTLLWTNRVYVIIIKHYCNEPASAAAPTPHWIVQAMWSRDCSLCMPTSQCVLTLLREYLYDMMFEKPNLEPDLLHAAIISFLGCPCKPEHVLVRASYIPNCPKETKMHGRIPITFFP